MNFILQKIKKLINDLQNPSKSLSEIKESLLKVSIILALIFATPTVIIAIIEAINFHQYSSLLLYLVVYILLWLNFGFYKLLSYRIKVTNLLFSIYLVAVQNFIIWGLSGAGIPILILFVVYTTILLGLEMGLLAILLSTLPMITVGFLMVNGVLDVTMDVISMSIAPISWLTAIGVMLMITLISVFSFGLIESHLLKSSKFIRKQSGELKKMNEDLIEDVKKRKLVEKKLRDRITLDILLNKISTKFIQINIDEIDNEINKALNDLAKLGNYEQIFLAIFNTKMKGYSDYYECNSNFTQATQKSILSIAPKEIFWNSEEKIKSDIFYLSEISELKSGSKLSSENSKFMILPMEYQHQKIGFLGIKKGYNHNIELEQSILLKTMKDIFTNIITHKRTYLEKNKIQEQLIQSQKLESIGNLSAGIAHDFNNLLTVILGNADIMKNKTDINHENYEFLDDIMDASKKAADLTQKMLLFSRKQLVELQPINMNSCIADLSKILQRIIGDNITIHTKLSEDLFTIEADKSNIEQVILNICSNARDAMLDGGEFVISTSNIIIDENNIDQIPYSRPGKFAALFIEDNGDGIEDSVLDKIFDPFFTTKEVGKGTGMGLSVVYGIIKSHNGWINIDTKIGKGTKFSIYFPEKGHKQERKRY